MGVDYYGNFGIGFKIQFPDFDESSEYYEDENCYLEECLEGTDFYYFEVGEGSYTEETNEIFVCIEKDFENGVLNTEECDKLKKLLIEKDLIYDTDKISCVGGLLVC